MEFEVATLQEAIAQRYPDREALVWRDRRVSWSALTDRTRRLADVLRRHGVGRVSPAPTEPWRSPHEHLALYLLNGPEYLEGMIGAWKAGAAAFNVNYRYVADELAYVLRDASARAVLYHGRYAAPLAEVLPQLDGVRLLLRVADGSGDELLPGALDYEEALASADPHGVDGSWSPDDRYIVYTGGTTGHPKGVLWRQADFLVAALGFRHRDGRPFASVEEVVERAGRGDRLRTLPAPPLMHGAAHWNALSTLLAGGTVVIQDHPEHLDAADVVATCERERATSLLIVGDAFARPLLDHLEASGARMPALRHLLTGGAVLSPAVKAALIRHLPHVQIVDVLGSSESGRQGVARSGAASGVGSGHFDRDDASAVLSADRSRLLEPGDEALGWLAQAGRVPLAYLGDPEKSAATFPVVEGVRYSVPGDRARLLADGTIELHGREASTINSGGEKIFAEEVEKALKHHPAVHDALVVGRPSERWGQEVVAVVSLRSGRTATIDELRDTAGAHIARYKLPKDLVLVERVPRSPSGKPDYQAARDLAVAAVEWRRETDGA